jgi:N6-adenosine-specific RNA methylase IME4
MSIQYPLILPRRDYKIVLADPPWMYFGDPNKPQAAGKHYTLMETETICDLPVRSNCAKDAVCFLWATGPKLPEALKVMTGWGFHYRGVAYVWVKTTRSGKIINGQGVRPTLVKPTTEFLLVGSLKAKGRPLPLLTESQPQVLLAPRPQGKHSKKPPEARRRIVELLGDLPRVELFARDQEPGWDVWGLQAPPTSTGVLTDTPAEAANSPPDSGEIGEYQS